MVLSPRQIIQLESAITEGNQKWVGAAPNFVVRPKINIMAAQEVDKANSGLWVIMEKEINSIDEPAAWARKYFVAASVS